MANKTLKPLVILIQPSGPLPADPRVYLGQEVTFRLDGVTAAEVRFTDGSCFSQPGPFFLSNASPLAANSEHTVTLTAAPRNYPYDLVLPPTAASRLGGNAETKKGGLDVTTDPPEDPK
ncbi:hypothetical protein NVS55_33300 [Myxococcus stipitatus]|uniref:hypothetical protein n=1 Tax=Myxococcus stipitatus TaxID=83455 RepID=UPI003144FCC1